MKALQQKTDFTDEQIDDFQCLADRFFGKCVALVGYDGITNYMHMIGAGHIRYYLRKWRNLNRFQNQGWEAYNAMIASFWHHRTKRGGGGKNQVDSSKIKPIARWILRLMLWKTGAAQDFFRSLEGENYAEGEESSGDSDSESNCSVSDYDDNVSNDSSSTCSDPNSNDDT